MIRIGDFKVNRKHKKAIKQVLKSGRLTEGPFVEKLEREIEKFLKVKHCILVTNGTVALQLVSMYLKDLLKKDKLNILCPAMTFPATTNAFLVGGHKVHL